MEAHSSKYKENLENELKLYDMLKTLVQFDHPYLATCLNNIGVSYSNLNENEKSLEYHTKAYEMRLRLYQTLDHPDLALSLFNIAVCYTNLNDFEKSLDHHMQAYEIRKKLYADDHPDLVASLLNIKSNYEKLNNYENSLKYLSKVINIIFPLTNFSNSFLFSN